MAMELATAYVSLIPTARNLTKNTTVALAGAVPVAEKTGRSMGSGIVSGIKTTAKGGLLTAGGLLATALYKGFKRTSDIENAGASLEGLGHTTKTVQKIMTNALASVKGTAFGLDEAATVAASVVAAGVKPGKNLESTLKRVADAATIGKVSMGEMGAIFGKVASSNKVQGDVINQLNAQGIPIVQLLGKTMGKTSDEIVDMSKKGQISFKDFEGAMDSIKGAALKSGDTTTGAWKNTTAALGRFGQALLAGIFPSFKKGLGGMTDVIDKATVAVAPFAKVIGEKLGHALEVAVKWISELDVNKIKDFWKTITSDNGSGNLSGLGASLRDIWSAGKDLAGIMPKVGGALGGLATSGIKVVTAVLGFLADHIDTIIKFLPAIIGGFVAWKVASSVLAVSQARLMLVQATMAPVFLASNILRLAAVRGEQRLAIATGQSTAAETVSRTGRLRNIIVLGVQKVATVAHTIATKASTVAQKALNLVMKANPIGLLIAAIVLLVGGLVWFFTKTEVGQKIIKVAWAAIKTAISGVVTWFRDKVVPWIRVAIGVITDKFKQISAVAKVVWEIGVKKPFQSMVKFIKETIPEGFRKGVGFVKDIFNRLRGIAAKPINFIIRTVYTGGIKKVFDKVAGAIGLKVKLPDVKPIPEFAKGGLARNGWALVGEKGPELYNFSQPSRVYTAAQTAAALGGQKSASSLRKAAGNSPEEATLPMGGWWGDAANNVKKWGAVVKTVVGMKTNTTQTAKELGQVVGWARGNLASMASGLLSPLVGKIDANMPKNRLGDIGRGISGKALDGLVSWIRGKDSEGGGFGDGAGGSFGPAKLSGGGFRPSSGPITSEFGNRWGRLHAGIDIAGGGPTFSPWDGIVERVGWNILSGRTGIGALIRNSKNLQSYFGHNPSLGAIKVRPGQLVKAGQRVGMQGATGNVTGIHLHLETIRGGHPVNPRSMLKFDSGGYLPPGVSTVVNKTGKPEPLANLDKLGVGGGGIQDGQKVYLVVDGHEFPMYIRTTIDGQLSSHVKNAQQIRRQFQGSN